MMAATLGINLRPPASNGVMSMPVGKPRTVDSICLGVSVYIKTHFSGMFLSYLPTTINDVRYMSTRCFGTVPTTITIA